MQEMNIKLVRVILIFIGIMIFFMWSCSRKVHLHSDAVVDRKAIPVMHTEDVMSLISDSGIVRYRIKAKVWDVFDKADTPFWDFPQGVYLEKFDVDMNIEAQLEADRGFYNQQEELWRLDGNVNVMNEDKEHFATPQLFWDQKKELIYSDSSIVITKTNSIIKGFGFRSNQMMTKYTILQPTGSFPLKDKGE